MNYQCTQCQKEDKLRKKTARLQAAAAKLFPASEKLVPASSLVASHAPNDDNDSDSDRDLRVSAKYATAGLTILDTVSQKIKRGRNLEKTFPAAVETVTAPPPAIPSFASSAAPAKIPKFRPTHTAPGTGKQLERKDVANSQHAKKSLTADFNSVTKLVTPAVVVSKISLRTVLKSAKHNFIMKKIPRDGHCFFNSIVKGMIDLCIPSCPKTATELRAACAEQVLAWKGEIPGRMIPMFDECGKFIVQEARGLQEKSVNLEEYCTLLRTSLYGGLEEIMVIVQMYKLQIVFYSDDCYRGGDPVPEKFLVNHALSEDAEENAGETNFYFGVVYDRCHSCSRALFSHRIFY